jgi:hypothetical protein
VRVEAGRSDLDYVAYFFMGHLQGFFLGRGFRYRPGKALRHPKTDLVPPRPTSPLSRVYWGWEPPPAHQNRGFRRRATHARTHTSGRKAAKNTGLPQKKIVFFCEKTGPMFLFLFFFALFARAMCGAGKGVFARRQDLDKRPTFGQKNKILRNVDIFFIRCFFLPS